MKIIVLSILALIVIVYFWFNELGKEVESYPSWALDIPSKHKDNEGKNDKQILESTLVRVKYLIEHYQHETRIYRLTILVMSLLIISNIFLWFIDFRKLKKSQNANGETINLTPPHTQNSSDEIKHD